MTDYRLQLKVRNARLLRAIEARGQQPGPKFATLVGISYSRHLLPYLNLTRAPFDAEGNLRPCAEKLCVYFNRLPSELWSTEQCLPLTQNTGEVELLRYGIDGPSHTLRDTAKTLKLSAERVRQLEARALSQLRRRRYGAEDVARLHYDLEV